MPYLQGIFNICSSNKAYRYVFVSGAVKQVYLINKKGSANK